MTLTQYIIGAAATLVAHAGVYVHRSHVMDLVTYCSNLLKSYAAATGRALPAGQKAVPADSVVGPAGSTVVSADALAALVAQGKSLGLNDDGTEPAPVSSGQ